MTDDQSPSSTGDAVPGVSRRQVLVTYAIVALILCCIHGRNVGADPLLHRDDRTLLAPLADWASYLRGFWGGPVLDLQPVRDASYLVDFALGRTFGIGTFHLTNLLLWLGIAWLAHRLLIHLVGNSRLALAGAALFALHPVFVNSVAWVSARKHLLACLFILLATNLLAWITRTEDRRRWPAWGLCVLYLLADLSQPIGLLWPLWAVLFVRLYARERLRRLVAPLAACVVLMVLCAAANYAYYSGPYALVTGHAKLVGGTGMGSISIAALAHGRALANLLLPISLATNYYPGSALNLLGLLLIPVLLLAAWKLMARRALLVWTSFYILPLLVVTVSTTNVFLSDPYLLLPGVGLSCALVLAAATRRDRFRGTRGLVLAGASVVALGCAYTLSSIREARAWSSDQALWAHAYEQEPSPNALAKHAYYLAGSGRAHEAVALALRLAEWQPSHPEWPIVLDRALTFDSSLTEPEKLAILQSHPGDSPWLQFFLGRRLAAAGEWSRAWELMSSALGDRALFGQDFGAVLASAREICRRAGASGCEELGEGNGPPRESIP